MCCVGRVSGWRCLVLCCLCSSRLRNLRIQYVLCMFSVFFGVFFSNPTFLFHHIHAWRRAATVRVWDMGLRRFQCWNQHRWTSDMWKLNLEKLYQLRCQSLFVMTSFCINDHCTLISYISYLQVIKMNLSYQHDISVIELNLSPLDPVVESLFPFYTQVLTPSKHP